MLLLMAGALALASIAVAAGTALGTPSLTPVRVTPGSGGNHTQFRLSLRIPAQTGVQARFSRTDTVSVTGPRPGRCVSHGSLVLPAAKARALVRVTLNPSLMGGSWCTGTFTGKIVQTERVSCAPVHVAIPCPQLGVAPQVIARFTFRVTPA